MRWRILKEDADPSEESESESIAEAYSEEVALLIITHLVKEQRSFMVVYEK